jgi:methylated-DNA-protein-cysteine methyltransferase-like protein
VTPLCCLLRIWVCQSQLLAHLANFSPLLIPEITCYRMPRIIHDESQRLARPGGVSRVRSLVLAVVTAIPEGRVTTYGAIGKHLHISARQVAYVLARLTPEESKELPWFRVVGANGFVSTTKLGAVGHRQIKRLKSEGVTVTARNKIEDFRLVSWLPR